MNKQTILIAGATGNIGGGAAVALAKRGAKIVLLGRKLKTLEDRAASIRATLTENKIDFKDTDIATLVVDFNDMVKSLTKGYGSIDYKFKGYEETKISKLDILIN